MQYGLIGAVLGHSYSPRIHAMLGNPDYQLLALAQPQAVQALFAQPQFSGLNITMPYKQLAAALCDWVDPVAHKIGAVNTVVNRGGKLCGYNTDLAGFEYLLQAHQIHLQGKCVMILGTGGTCRTVKMAAQRQKAGKIILVSRKAGPQTLSYEQASVCEQVQVLINTTPVGMHPNEGSCLLDLNRMTGLEAVVDVVYRPFKTELVLRAQQMGIPAVGGFEMLVAQAVYADQLFRGISHSCDTIPRIYRRLLTELTNVSLIGMPGSGKTTIGKLLAQHLDKAFVDLDTEIERWAGKSIAQIFAQDGQQVFRQMEAQTIKKFSSQSGQVLSCGGGAVLRPDNVHRLRQNGPVLFLQRPVEELELGNGRPLSTDAAALAAMQQQRYPLYQQAADGSVLNCSQIDDAVQTAVEVFYEIIDSEWA